MRLHPVSLIAFRGQVVAVDVEPVILTSTVGAVIAVNDRSCCATIPSSSLTGCMQVATPSRPNLAAAPAQLRGSCRHTATRDRRTCAAPRAQHNDHPAGPAKHESDQLQQERGQEQGPRWNFSLPSMDTRSVARRLVGPMAAAAVLFGGLGAVAPVDPAFAADALATCSCLIKKCRCAALHNPSLTVLSSSRPR